MASRSRRWRRLFGSRLGREWRRIPLADRCLIFIFFLLLLQSAVVLFCPFLVDGGEIDVIIRTSAASIFGYLLGGGMGGADPAPTLEPLPDAFPERAAGQSPDLPQEEAKTAAAGAPLLDADPMAPPASLSQLPAASPLPASREGCDRFRVLTAAGIGLFCLLSLLLLRDWPGLAAATADSPGATAIVVQFRDFISGSLGFLTGCSSRSGGDSPP